MRSTLYLYWVILQERGEQWKRKIASSLFFKSRLGAKSLIWKSVLFLMQINSFTHERFCNWPRFESERFWNSEMAQSPLSSSLVNAIIRQFYGTRWVSMKRRVLHFYSPTCTNVQYNLHINPCYIATEKRIPAVKPCIFIESIMRQFYWTWMPVSVLC